MRIEGRNGRGSRKRSGRSRSKNRIGKPEWRLGMLGRAGKIGVEWQPKAEARPAPVSTTPKMPFHRQDRPSPKSERVQRLSVPVSIALLGGHPHKDAVPALVSISLLALLCRRDQPSPTSEQVRRLPAPVPIALLGGQANKEAVSALVSMQLLTLLCHRTHPGTDSEQISRHSVRNSVPVLAAAMVTISLRRHQPNTELE